MEQCDRELTNQILAWKFPLVWEKVWGKVQGKVWGKVQGKVWGMVKYYVRIGKRVQPDISKARQQVNIDRPAYNKTDKQCRTRTTITARLPDG